MYQISRCVDAGDFHKILEQGSVTDLTLIEFIPICCKVSIAGKPCPLKISVRRFDQRAELYAFISFKNSDPTEADCDLKFFNPTYISIEETVNRIKTAREKFRTKLKSNEVVNFKSNFVYINFLSSKSLTIKVSITFPKMKAINNPADEEKEK